MTTVTITASAGTLHLRGPTMTTTTTTPLQDPLGKVRMRLRQRMCCGRRLTFRLNLQVSYPHQQEEEQRLLPKRTVLEQPVVEEG